MPDLDAAAVGSWLRERGPDVVALPVTGPVDADLAALGTLLRLGATLDDARARDAEDLTRRLLDTATMVNLRAAVTQLGTGRRLRLLDWLAGLSATRSQALLSWITAPGEHGDFIRGELQALHRAALLARIFAPERRALLLAVCQPSNMTGGVG